MVITQDGKETITLTPAGRILTIEFLLWARAWLRFMGKTREEHGEAISDKIFYSERTFDLPEGGHLRGGDCDCFDDIINDIRFTWIRRIMEADLWRDRAPNKSQLPRLQVIDAYLHLHSIAFDPDIARWMIDIDRRIDKATD